MTGQRVIVAGMAGTVIRRYTLTIFESWIVRLDCGCVLVVAPRDMEVVS